MFEILGIPYNTSFTLKLFRRFRATEFVYRHNEYTALKRANIPVVKPVNALNH